MPRSSRISSAQTQVEAHVKPDRVSDDLRWKTMALVADGLCLHRRQLRPNGDANNLGDVNVTTPDQSPTLMSIMPHRTQFECPYQGHFACCAFAMETGTMPVLAATKR